MDSEDRFVGMIFCAIALLVVVVAGCLLVDKAITDRQERAMAKLGYCEVVIEGSPSRVWYPCPCDSVRVRVESGVVR